MPTPTERSALIDKIRTLPSQIEALVKDLMPDELTAHYLDGEWSVAQNVHHLVDSHMNSYIRCKLIMTEDHPTLCPYQQEIWAELPDASQADIRASLAMLHALHARWVVFWSNLSEIDWQRVGFHPENGDMSLDDILRIYADHGEAHIDQIQRTLAAQR